MNRISQKDVNVHLAMVNKALGKPDYYTTNTMSGIGTRIVADDGSRDVSPRGTVRAAYDWARAMHEGIMMAREVDNVVASETRADYLPTPVEQCLTSDEIIASALSILEERVCRADALTSSSATRKFLAVRAADLTSEVFSVIWLDNQNRVISVENLFNGTIDGAAVYPREVVKAALAANAAAVVFTHNHPSGIADPSQADIAITRKLKTALQSIEVKILDHVITAGGSTYSMAEHGQI